MKIGFIGQMRAGKDTAANYLSEVGSHILKFADPLYEIQDFAQNLTGFPKIKDRQMLQWLGTEWGRQRDPDIWVKVLERKLKGLSGNIFVTDVRFKNEVVMLKNNKFKIVLIQATDEIRINRGATNEVHKSEEFSKTFEDFDYRIENNGTLEEFYQKLDLLRS